MTYNQGLPMINSETPLLEVNEKYFVTTLKQSSVSSLLTIL